VGFKLVAQKLVF